MDLCGADITALSDAQADGFLDVQWLDQFAVPESPAHRFHRGPLLLADSRLEVNFLIQVQDTELARWGLGIPLSVLIRPLSQNWRPE